MPMTLISRTTLTTSAASVTFNSIPQTFQTLKLVVSARTDFSNQANGDGIVIRPNTSTSNLSSRWVYGLPGVGTGSSSSASLILATYATNANQTASTFGNGEVTIPNYSGSTNKAISGDGVSENNGTSSIEVMSAGLWSNTSAIVSLEIRPEQGSNLLSGSTFSLYGVS